jgi:hypothetical protein
MPNPFDWIDWRSPNFWSGIIIGAIVAGILF